MELQYTYWEAEECGYIGFVNQYPDQWTQRETLEELERIKNKLAKKIIKRLS